MLQLNRLNLYVFQHILNSIFGNMTYGTGAMTDSQVADRKVEHIRIITSDSGVERNNSGFDQIQLTRSLKNGFAVRISGIGSKEEADALKGLQLFAPRDVLPNLPDDEFYHADLIGLAVFDTGGAQLGTVKSVQNHGAADLLEIQGPGLKTTVLLPFTLDAVPTVDLAQGRIVADPPEGLF